ncbi:MAG TPA: PEP-CTERM sorting domain-containing protein [Chthoniobacterales bacterium]
MKKFLTLALGLTIVVSLHAANVGFDDAGNPAYNADDANGGNDGNPANNTNGWVNGDNGGSGFGAWVLQGPGDNNVAHGGFFMGSSASNAGGSSGNINTAGRSWGMFANNGQTVSAIRPLTGLSLLVGQTITLSIDNGFLDTGSSEGFGLQTSGGVNRLEFFFTGGDANYRLSDSAGANLTPIGFTGNGLSFAFTLTGTDTYSLAVTPNGGSTTFFGGTLAGVAGTGIDQLRFFDFNGGNNQGTNGDFFANLLTVPEPSTYLAAGMALIGCAYLRRRRVRKA